MLKCFNVYSHSIDLLIASNFPNTNPPRLLLWIGLSCLWAKTMEHKVSSLTYIASTSYQCASIESNLVIRLDETKVNLLVNRKGKKETIERASCILE